MLVQPLRDPVESRMKYHSVIQVPFLSVVPFAVSTLEILPQKNDLIMSVPFEELDEFFLRRQAAAFGEASVS